MTIEKRWHDFWMLSPSASREKVIDARKRLWKRYREAHRAYHTLEHIESCLALLDASRNLAANPWVVEAGIYYHDVIYDTQRKDNETRSWRLAMEDISRMGGTADFADAVRSVIRATRHSFPVSGRDEQLICDIDLACLGSSWQEFAKDSENIRKEYAWITEEEYRRRRAGILRDFLDREHIYYLPQFRWKYEEQARKNLHKALQELSH